MARAKADNPTVREYLDGLSSPMKPLVLKLRSTVLEAVKGLQEDIKWGNCLTFSYQGRNIIQTVVGKDKVTLIFFEGINLRDPAGLLEGEGKKVRSARFYKEQFGRTTLQALVKQAARLAV